jgi:methyl-accepting chemotaxis protein
MVFFSLGFRTMRLQARLLWVVLPLMALAVLVLTLGLSFYSKQTVLRQAGQDGQLLVSVLSRSIQVSQHVEQAAEQVVSSDLVTSANILAQFVATAEQCKLPDSAITQRLRALVRPDNLAEVWVTDSLGRAYLHTVPDVDFTFSPDPSAQPQASEFWPLLTAKNPTSVVQALKPREVDGRAFKYVGVNGVDRPRIVQVGMDGARLMQLRKSLGVQELLDQVIREDSIQQVWVVDQRLTIEGFSSNLQDMAQRNLTLEDRELLAEVLENRVSQSRIHPGYIAVAASLEPGEQDGVPEYSVRATGAILVHMSTALLDQLLFREILFAAIAAAILMLMSGMLLMGFTRRLLRPVHEAAVTAERVASGDLSATLSAEGSDEISKLINALGQMVNYLNSLIGQVQRSTIDLVSTANSLSAMTKTQSEEVSNLGSTTTEIAAATKEISATSEELLSTMSGITEVADHTTELANSGQSSLGDMEGAMRTLADATHSISSRLGLINEKANTISSVTTTITKIADQTNLLSLNASIEAEKAGEYGLGFAVLAREIRRLADQTAVATLDIEQMVKEMQDSVTGGVMEMDKFSEQVSRSVSDTHDISLRFGEIIQQIQALLPQFDAVHEGMRSQSAGAKQIRDSMVSLTDSFRVSAQALDETTSATQRLEGAIDELRNEISSFKLR